MRAIRLATDLSLVGPWNTIHLLEPFSSAVVSNPDREPRRASVATGYSEAATALFALTPMDQADLAVLPCAWEDVLADRGLRDRALRFCRAAADAGRVILVFYHSDRPVHVAVDNAVVFRTSLYRSRRAATDVALPAWVEDLPRVVGAPMRPRPHRAVPTVSFAGVAAPLGTPSLPFPRSLAARARRTVRDAITRRGWDHALGVRPSLVHRVAAIQAVRAGSGLRTDFLLRSAPTRWNAVAGAIGTASGGVSPERYREEYVANLLAGDYVLAVRGEGNFSLRFYEALTCVRIPLFVDTDCVLPFENELDYRRLCIRIDFAHLDDICRRLTDEHRAMAAEEFVDRQWRCRRVWEERLSMGGFFRTVRDRLVPVVEGSPAVETTRVAAALR